MCFRKKWEWHTARRTFAQTLLYLSLTEWLIELDASVTRLRNARSSSNSSIARSSGTKKLPFRYFSLRMPAPSFNSFKRLRSCIVTIAKINCSSWLHTDTHYASLMDQRDASSRERSRNVGRKTFYRKNKFFSNAIFFNYFFAIIKTWKDKCTILRYKYD